jgi:hypothetical protein
VVVVLKAEVTERLTAGLAERVRLACGFVLPALLRRTCLVYVGYNAGVGGSAH